MSTIIGLYLSVPATTWLAVLEVVRLAPAQRRLKQPAAFDYGDRDPRR